MLWEPLKKNILYQFLTEAALITFLGGILGIVLGVLGSLLLATIIGWPFIISATAIFISLAFSMLIGIICGIIPANRAASLDPIKALKYE